MGTIEKIYEVLQENLSYPPEVWLEDLVTHGCGYRHFLALTGAEAAEPERPQDIIIRETDRKIREMIRRYLEGAFPDRFNTGFTFNMNGTVLVDIVGMLDKDVLVEVVSLSNAVYQKKGVPKSVRIAAVAKAHIAKAKKIWLILIDRNSQEWSSWKIDGDFKVTGDPLVRESMFIKGLEDGTSVGMGTAGKSTCSRCPFKASCTANPIGDPEGFTEDISMTLDPDLTTKLDQYLWTLNEGENKWQKGRISPSHFSTSTCDRAVAYGLLSTDEKPRIDAKLRRIFDVGHAFHDVLQAALFWAYPDDFEEEVKMELKQYRIRGSCDGVRAPVSRGFELKSISVKAFPKLSSAKSDHVKQATMYRKGLKLDTMEYLYVCKDDGNLKSFEPPLDNKKWHKIADRAERIVKSAKEYEEDNGEMPPKLEGKEWACRKCIYGWTCRPDLFRTKKQAAARRRFARR